MHAMRECCEAWVGGSEEGRRADRDARRAGFEVVGVRGQVTETKVLEKNSGS